MTAIEPLIVKGGCTYHAVECMGPRRFRVDVFRDGDMFMAVDDDEPTFSGGEHVARLYRSTEALATHAGIEYSFVTHRKGDSGTGFKGVTGPKYGRSLGRA